MEPITIVFIALACFCTIMYVAFWRKTKGFDPDYE
jgi:hypothetical protein